MKREIALTLLVLASLLLSLGAVQPVHSSPLQTIYIQPDGSVNPQSAPIHRIGDLFTLTGDITSQIIIKANNIVLDGGGHTLQGSGSGIAVNMTCSNVTLENLTMINWKAGVLGVFNNDTVKNCLITQCQSGIKNYAQSYNILGNDIENNGEGILIEQGGLNVIAGNNITNNPVALYLYDSNNLIIQNNIVNCSQSAITLDSASWSQTVYHNNFVNNQREITDYTYSVNGRPVQSALVPWDNGSSGNYWSDYPGTDLNGDGIGDSSFMVPTYFSSNELAPYSFADRYPIMEPYNISAGQIPPVYVSPATPQSPLSANNQALALSFMQNVVGLDLNKYTATLTFETLRNSSSGIQSEYLSYSLVHSSTSLGTSITTATASVTVSNNTVTEFSLEPTSGQLLYTYSATYNVEMAKTIMQNYQAWKNDSDVGTMADLLNTSGQNSTQQSGSIELETTTNLPHQTSFTWSYNYYGIDYSSVNLVFYPFNGFSYISFSDNRGIYSVGSTSVNIPQQQAVQIAEDCIRNFSYPMNYGNGTIVAVSGLNIKETNIIVNLTTATTLGSTTLNPCWIVQVPLDHVYLGETEAVTVGVWADNGVVFSVQRDVVPLSPTSSTLSSYASVLSSLLFFAIIIIAVLGAISVTVVLVAFRFKSQRKKTPK